MDKQDVQSLLDESQVILYGAGRVGMNVLGILEANHVQVGTIFDANSSRFVKPGIRVTEPVYREDWKAFLIVICICSPAVCDETRKTLEEMGYQHVISYEELMDYFQGCPLGNSNLDIRTCSKCLVERGGCERYRARTGGGGLRLKLLVIEMTTACTLSCRGCIAHVSEYRDKGIRMDTDIKQFRQCWDKFIQAVDGIGELMFSGGEVFLYPDLAKMLSLVVSSPKVQVVNLITNGTVMPDEEMIRLLKHEKIVVSVDDYGENLSEALRKRADGFRRMLADERINFTVIDNTMGTWYELKDFKDQGRTGEEDEQIFHNCVWNSRYSITVDLRFEVCFIQNCLKNLGCLDIPENCEEDGINLLTASTEVIRERLLVLCSQKVLKMCKYCEGSHPGNIIPAGIQTKTC